jgi:hypothetical protein
LADSAGSWLIAIFDSTFPVSRYLFGNHRRDGHEHRLQLDHRASRTVGEAEMTARRDMSVRILWIKVITILVIITVWELTARSGLFFEGVVPSTVSVLGALAREISDQSFYRDLGVTMLESSVGFLFGSTIAIAVGISLGLNSYLRRMIEPFILAIGGTPKIVFLPILFLIFGLGIESKMANRRFRLFSRGGQRNERVRPNSRRTAPRRPQFPSRSLANGDQDLHSSDAKAVADRFAAWHGGGDHRRSLSRDHLLGSRTRL